MKVTSYMTLVLLAAISASASAIEYPQTVYIITPSLNGGCYSALGPGFESEQDAEEYCEETYGPTGYVCKVVGEKLYKPNADASPYDFPSSIHPLSVRYKNECPDLSGVIFSSADDATDFVIKNSFIDRGVQYIYGNTNYVSAKDYPFFKKNNALKNSNSTAPKLRK